MIREIGDFLAKNDQLILDVSERFRTHNRRPTSEKVTNYLAQFESYDRARLALKILQAVEFIDAAKTRAIFREFFFNKLSQEQRSRAVFAVLGGPEDSSSLISYHCSKALAEPEKPNQLFMPLKQVIEQHAAGRALVLFADDNIGSGKQSTAIFREWMGIATGPAQHGGPLTPSERNWLKKSELFFFFLTGFTEGIEILGRELKRLGLRPSFWAARKMSEAVGCFSPSSPVFEDDSDRTAAQEMAKEIGYELLHDKAWEESRKRECALGYGNSQKLIVFSYNTPTCTLPLLWKSGIYNGKLWEPLFPRMPLQQFPKSVQLTHPPALPVAVHTVKVKEHEIESPYNFTEPAKELFRGRETELRQLASIVRNRRSAVIFGMQRVGKTSLVLKVLDEEVERGAEFHRNVIRLEIDAFNSWESFTSANEFIFMILDRLADYLGEDPQKTKETFREFVRASYSADDRLKKFQTLLQRGAERTKSSLLLFIDEFHDIQKAFENPRNDKVNPFDAGIIRWLGYLVKSRIIQLLVCTRHKAIRMEKKLELELFKLLEEIHLGPLDWTSARSLICDPATGLVRYEDQAISEILALTGSQPYLIQYFCNELIKDPNILRSRVVRKRDVDKWADAITSDPIRESKFHLLYQDFQEIDGGLPWKALLALASKADSASKPVRRDEIQEILRNRLDLTLSQGGLQTAMSSLTLSTIVNHDSKSPIPSYRIGPDMLRLWLRKQRLIDRAN